MSESINDKAREYTDSLSASMEVPVAKFVHVKDAYIAGHNQCEKDMQEKASDGFENWWIIYGSSNEFQNNRDVKVDLKESWQAATLSSDKRHAERLNVEARKEIQSLKEIIKELSNALESYDFGRGTIGHDTLKRVNEKMREV